MLYEQLVEDLRRASQAIDENRIDARTNAINHAIVITGHLQSRLNHEDGGEVARNLERFYNLLRQKLLEAQFQGNREILAEQTRLLLELRDAWTEVDRAETARSTSLPAPPSEISGDVLGREVHADWKG
jgi:flagellar protein FliS